jgi:hypothetical protein
VNIRISFVAVFTAFVVFSLLEYSLRISRFSEIRQPLKCELDMWLGSTLLGKFVQICDSGQKNEETIEAPCRQCYVFAGKTYLYTHAVGKPR